MPNKQLDKQLDKVLKAQKNFWNDFKDFLVKGNAVSLAIGIIIGAAFQAVINSVVNDVFMPIISLFTRLVGTEENLAEKYWDLTSSALTENGTRMTLEAARHDGHIVITYGALLAALINFLIIGFVAFMIVRSLTSVEKIGKKTRRKLKNAPPEPEPAPTTKECPFCISEIPVKATRCPYCTSHIGEAGGREQESGN